MEDKRAICLVSQYPNLMKVKGDEGWFIRKYNASTGYTWRFRPDNSGVYKMREHIVLYPSTTGKGVPGKEIWKFEAIRDGEGRAMFELFPPGSEEAVETVIIKFEVST